MFSAAVCLAALFVFPMWKITLLAPQYPDGVSLHIWINKIGGETPGTLQNINILNHYVGMKYIEPDAIPELTYFPFIVGAMVGLGLLAALLNRPKLFLAWAVVMIIISLLGIYDFYLWEYDYGHNLSDTAPIKVPGQSYQPPLLGRATILNFTAISLPHIGGYLAGLGIILSLIASYLGLKSKARA
jgi:hypothetical protein